MIGRHLWDKLVRTIHRPPAKFLLTDDARRVLAQAEARGYRVVVEIRQGSPAMVLKKEDASLIHLWSSDDIIEYGRHMNWT